MPTTKPQGVVPSDPNVNLFGRIIQEAYAGMASKLTDADLTTPSRRTAVLNEIKDVVDHSDQAVQAWVKVNIGGFYELGLWETAKDLNERGSAIRFDPAFTHFHREALEAIAQETYNDIATGMTGITRTAERLVTQATTENIINKIGRGQVTGENNRELVKLIKDEFKKNGITSLTDRSGRAWDLDRYGEMLVRTKLTQAHNTGVANRMIESGNDLVVVSNHQGACRLCAPWEGKVLSLTGRNKSYLSLDLAKKGGLFHPNCRHVYTPYANKYLDVSVGWDADKGQYRPYQKLRSDIIARNKAKLVEALKKTTYKKAVETVATAVSGARVAYANKSMELTPFETDLMKRRELTISEDEIKGRAKNTRYGEYSASDNEIRYGKKLLDRKPADVEATFRHEYGHFIDAQFRDYKGKQYYGFKDGVKGWHTIPTPDYLSKDLEFINAFKGDSAKKIIINRLKRDEQLAKLKDEELETLLRGGKIPTGDNRHYALSASYRKYLRSNSEIFADAYSQFRTMPEVVKATMPEVYNYFIKLTELVL